MSSNDLHDLNQQHAPYVPDRRGDNEDIDGNDSSSSIWILNSCRNATDT